MIYKNALLIDKLIICFITLFLATLTNSIFLNQIGYYGAFLLILYKMSFRKEIQFKKTGLEFFFLAFIIAEFISFLFSLNQSQAFHFMMKRILLIPTFYVFTVYCDSLEKAKYFFNIYMLFALISAAIQIYYSYDYIVYKLYKVYNSGPVVFQHPITASVILSFTAIFAFSFFLSDKKTNKNKILYFLAFLGTTIALVANFKRTGWIGFATALFFMLVLSRKTILIALIIAISLVMLTLDQNYSRINLYEIGVKGFCLNNTYETNGKARKLAFSDNYVLAADNEEGIISVDSVGKIKNIFTPPSPAWYIKHWRDSIWIVLLMDMRFVALEGSGIDTLIFRAEFSSPGLLGSIFINNEALYALDRDSGLTAYINPYNLTETRRRKDIKNSQLLNVTLEYFYFYSDENKEFIVYSKRNLLPDSILLKKKISDASNFLFVKDIAIISDYEGTKTLFISKDTLKFSEINSGLKNCYFIIGDDKYYLFSRSGKVSKITFNEKKEIEIINSFDLGYSPPDVLIDGERVYTIDVKESRIKTIWDPYTPTNATRIQMWTAAIKIFLDYPLFGVGDIGVEKLHQKYGSKYEVAYHGHFHSNFFHLLATLGLFGTLAATMIFVFVIYKSVKFYNRLKEYEFYSAYSLGAFGCMISFIVSGLTEFNFGDHEIITLVWFIAGLNFAIYNVWKKNYSK